MINDKNFLFVSTPLDFEIFEESTQPYARIEITACELDKISTNGRVYQFEEAETLRQTLEGSEILWGITRDGKHKKRTTKVGFVESAKIVGNKIKAVIKVTETTILDKIRNGARNFMFSVGGIADAARLVKEGGKKFLKMIGAKITHLQMWQSSDPTSAGFASAKVEKVIEFSECTLVTGEQTGLSERDLALLVLGDVI